MSINGQEYVDVGALRLAQRAGLIRELAIL
jgi:hypothetical protein